MEIKANARLALRNLPWTDCFAFTTTQANAIIDPHNPIGLFVSSTPWAEIGTWWIDTMETSPWDMDFKRLVVICSCNCLNEEPIVRREPVVHMLLFRPIGNLRSIPGVHSWKRFDGFRKFGLVCFSTGLHTGAAANTTGEVEKRG